MIGTSLLATVESCRPDAGARSNEEGRGERVDPDHGWRARDGVGVRAWRVDRSLNLGKQISLILLRTFDLDCQTQDATALRTHACACVPE
jgi:hypothetical protein